MSHISATPGSTIRGLARCCWRLTIDLAGTYDVRHWIDRIPDDYGMFYDVR